MEYPPGNCLKTEKYCYKYHIMEKLTRKMDQYVEKREFFD